MDTHVIDQVCVEAFYPAGTIEYKIKGSWVWFVNGHPFIQADTRDELLALIKEIVS